MRGVVISRFAAYSMIAVVLVVLLVFAGLAGCKSFNRYQKRADATNNVRVTNINIKKAQQQARIVDAQVAATRARARKRIVEARGIRTAQDLIAKTLTPLYVQHEAIEAQKHGGHGDKTYIPVGPQGVPLVADLNKDKIGEPQK